jgi:hypothetical protein
MGQARQKRLSQAALLAANPFCVYCGGTQRATTVDHMPPRIFFRAKLRPGQFEFPSCHPCNQGTKDTDQLIAWLGRVYPDATNEMDKADVKKILKGLENNQPEVLKEMYIGPPGQELARKRVPIDEEGGFLRLDGPLVSRHLDVFGCKLGLAMHWERTGKIVPATGGVAVRYYSNVEALEGKLPKELLSLLPGPQTLRQGKWEVADQFQYAAQVTADHKMGLFFASFRLSLSVAAVSAMDRSLFGHRMGPVFSPAELWKSKTG